MTFHVRLVSLPHRTNGLAEALAADAGVSNLVVLPGAARGPGGDAVQFDVAPRSANSVFRQLQAFPADALHDLEFELPVEVTAADRVDDEAPVLERDLLPTSCPANDQRPDRRDRRSGP